MRKVSIVQARVDSSRLFGKILKLLPGGYNCLQHVIMRIKKSKLIDDIVIATTDRVEDDSIEKIACEMGVSCLRGDSEDVLKRYYDAAVRYESDIIIRITGDCPCIDAEVIDFVITEHLFHNADFTSNAACGEGVGGRNRTFPRGTDVEIISFSALQTSHFNANGRLEREHVTPYIIAHPEIFKLHNIEAPPKWKGNDIRITLDTHEDFILLSFIFDYLGSTFTLKEVINLFQLKPWLKYINCHVDYRPIFEELPY